MNEAWRAEEGVSDWRVFDDWTLNPVHEAALKLFEMKGYHGTSIREIAKSAGLSVPGLYHYMDSKEDALASLLFRGIREANARSTAAIAEVADQGVEARFRALVRSVILYWTYRQKITAIGAEYRHLGPELKAEYLLLRQQFQKKLLALIREGCESGSFVVDDPRYATRAVLLMGRGVAEWFRMSGPDNPERVADTYVEYALRIVSARQA